MEVIVKHQKGMHFTGQADSPVTIPMDTKPDFGGQELGPTPMELLLMAAAGCSGMDVVSILGKMREEYDRFEIKVQGTRAEEHPKVFTAMNLVYSFWGSALNEEKIRRAIELSIDKYCSVMNTVNKVAKVDYRLELNP